MCQTAKSLAELGIVLPKPAGSGRQTEVFDDRGAHARTTLDVAYFADERAG